MKKIKKIGLGIMMAILALGIVACSSPAQAIEPEPDVETAITIKHELGETSISGQPKNVIVFDYGVLDTLDKIDQGIIGLPKQSLPEYLDKYRADEYEDVGSLKEPNFEKIYELSPDLIIISGRQRDLYDEFAKIAPTVYLDIDGGKYMESLRENANIIGEIFNKEELLKAEIENIEKEIAKVNEIATTNEKNALFIMANDGNLSAFGAGSRFGFLHNELGVTPVDEGLQVTNHGDKIAFEYIVEKDPDYIYVMDRAAVAGGDISAKQVMDNDLIKSTSAYENERIIYLDAHSWYVSAGGLTSTMEMIDEVRISLGK